MSTGKRQIKTKAQGDQGTKRGNNARPRAQATNAAAERQAYVTATAEHVRAGGVTFDGDQPKTAPKQHTPPSSIEDEWQQRKQSMRGRATSRTKRSAKHRDPATHTVVEQRAQAAAEAMNARAGGVTHEGA